MAEFYDVLQSNRFQTQCRYYVNQASIAVKSEAPTHPNHDDRVLFANKVLAGIAPFYEMSLSIGSNATIRGKIEADQEYDSDIAYVVTTIYDAYAVA